MSKKPKTKPQAQKAVSFPELIPNSILSAGIEKLITDASVFKNNDYDEGLEEVDFLNLAIYSKNVDSEYSNWKLARAKNSSIIQKVNRRLLQYLNGENGETNNTKKKKLAVAEEEELAVNKETQKELIQFFKEINGEKFDKIIVELKNHQKKINNFRDNEDKKEKNNNAEATFYKAILSPKEPIVSPPFNQTILCRVDEKTGQDNVGLPFLLPMLALDRGSNINLIFGGNAEDFEQELSAVEVIVQKIDKDNKHTTRSWSVLSSYYDISNSNGALVTLEENDIIYDNIQSLVKSHFDRHLKCSSLFICLPIGALTIIKTITDSIHKLASHPLMMNLACYKVVDKDHFSQKLNKDQNQFIDLIKKHDKGETDDNSEKYGKGDLRDEAKLVKWLKDDNNEVYFKSLEPKELQFLLFSPRFGFGEQKLNENVSARIKALINMSSCNSNICYAFVSLPMNQELIETLYNQPKKILEIAGFLSEEEIQSPPLIPSNLRKYRHEKGLTIKKNKP